MKLWVGFGATAVSVAAPGFNLVDLQCIVRGPCLQVKGPGPESPVIDEIDLPYPVRDKPVAIGKYSDENALYLLLKRSL